jgi:hypothetical protein
MGHPEDGFDKASALGSVTNIDVWAGSQELEYFRPLVVPQLYWPHTSSLMLIQMSTQPSYFENAATVFQ